ncbi:hypothetical protein [Coprococcus comes]
MKEEKKESPIGVLWGWGKPYHGKFIGSVILMYVVGIGWSGVSIVNIRQC